MFSRKWIIVIIIVVVLLAVAVAAYTYFLLGEPADGAEEPIPSELTTQQMELSPKEASDSWRYSSITQNQNEGTIAYTAVFPIFTDKQADQYFAVSKEIIIANEKLKGNNDSIKFDTKQALDSSQDLQAYYSKEKEAFFSFCKAMQQKLKQAQNLTMPCERTTEMKVTRTASTLMTITMRSYNYLGGANGDTSINTYNFVHRQDSFKLLRLEDLLVREGLPKLTKIAEQQFRFKFNMLNVPLDKDSGFDFPEGRFSLPSSPYSFSFTAQGLEFTYALYEIASRSDGFITFTLPYTLLYNILLSEFNLNGEIEESGLQDSEKATSES